ncbi:unnamed protein product [Acanthoscelides obtectus]|nr:unnamed protein product [Acanthoscelides obtectus]CAK1683117.1 hypothetical protein AOBTE_LOCUS34090 [Acanthoscelides obtectus]
MIRRLINTFSSRACVSSLGFQHSTNSNRAFRMKLFYLLLLLAIFIVTITCAQAERCGLLYCREGYHCRNSGTLHYFCRPSETGTTADTENN